MIGNVNHSGEKSAHTRTFFLKKRIQRPLTLRLISCDLLVLYIFVSLGMQIMYCIYCALHCESQSDTEATRRPISDQHIKAIPISVAPGAPSSGDAANNTASPGPDAPVL